MGMQGNLFEQDEALSPFMDVAAAALYLNVSRSSLDRSRSVGGGPPYRKHFGKIVYHIDDLDEWSRKRTYCDTGTKAVKSTNSALSAAR